MLASVCTNCSGPSKLIGFWSARSSATSDFAPFVDVNLIDAIVMSTTPNNCSVKLVSSPVASEVGGFPLRSFWMVTWSVSADVPPALNSTFTGIGVGSNCPSKSFSWGCQVRTVTSSFGCIASGLAWVRIVGALSAALARFCASTGMRSPSGTVPKSFASVGPK